MYGEIYIISYDANGTIIDVSTSSLYLDKKETKTTSETVYKSPYSHPNFDHYEIVYGGYYTKNKFRSFLDDYKDKGGIIVILPLFY